MPSLKVSLAFRRSPTNCWFRAHRRHRRRRRRRGRRKRTRRWIPSAGWWLQQQRGFRVPSSRRRRNSPAVAGPSASPPPAWSASAVIGVKVRSPGGIHAKPKPGLDQNLFILIENRTNLQTRTHSDGWKPRFRGLGQKFKKWLNFSDLSLSDWIRDWNFIKFLTCWIKLFGLSQRIGPIIFCFNFSKKNLLTKKVFLIKNEKNLKRVPPPMVKKKIGTVLSTNFSL